MSDGVYPLTVTNPGVPAVPKRTGGLFLRHLRAACQVLQAQALLVRGLGKRHISDSVIERSMSDRRREDKYVNAQPSQLLASLVSRFLPAVMSHSRNSVESVHVVSPHVDVVLSTFHFCHHF